MCYNNEDIDVPKEDVDDMLELGAICGSCATKCCPDEPTIDGKIDMCLNGNTINVNQNACKGILNAGGTCGACEEE
jgi:hypothetical protein